MAPPGVFAISSSSALNVLPPPKPIVSAPLPPPRQNLQHCPHRSRTTRRDAVLLSLLALIPSFSQPDACFAFSIGISGPKDWLREQKKKASRFLLAPIDASRGSLRTAYLIISTSDSDDPSRDLGQVQRLLRSAARDCVPQERNSFVSFQASTGVEVCTFRLILKNASSLLDDKSPVKLEAEAMLGDLIGCRSFITLDGISNNSDIHLSSDRQKLANALNDTIYSLGKFEQGIKDCLEI